VALAVDFDKSATDVYATNFPKATLHTDKVEAFFDGELRQRLTSVETRTVEDTGEVALLAGGPPCQGHSDLNNRTRRDDPKNALYARMARAAEVLAPAAVLIENVPAVQHDRRDVVGQTRKHLARLGYQVDDRVVATDRLGVAQRRKRHILLALQDSDPSVLLDRVQTVDESRSLRWAIGDLAQLTDPTGLDQPPKASADNLARMLWLLEHHEYDLPNSLRPPCHQNETHSYKSMYGRLSWDQPAQTITSGYGSIGQGRFMHPSAARALTAHEAARLQDFPDYFDFDAVRKRADLATVIGNAVPPALSRIVVNQLLGATTA
jgi:DNA (cytosine-5)-methyltransferase 1